jgi:hypothetical protein
MAQDWDSPRAYSAAPTQPQMAAAYALRPLSLGELLDRTFSVYKSRFWLFAGIGAISAVLQTVIGAVQLIPMHLAGAVGAAGTIGRTRGPFGLPAGPAGANYLTGIGIGLALAIMVVVLLYLLVFVVTQAATVYALSEVYLGKVTTIGDSLRATVEKWYRYLGIGIWQAFSLMWIPMVVVVAGAVLMAMHVSGLTILGGLLIFVGAVGGFPVGVILWLRNSLGVQATVIEGLTVRQSMARSKVLTGGAKGRVFVLMLLAGALSYAVSLLQMPLLLFVTFTLARGGKAVGSEIAMLVVGFVGRGAVQPVLMIGLSLLYFDQRVRKEAFDLLMLLGPEGAPVTAEVPAVWPPVVAVEAAVWPPIERSQDVAEGVRETTMSISVPPISAAPIATEPIVAGPIDEPMRPRTDDETLS